MKEKEYNLAQIYRNENLNIQKVTLYKSFIRNTIKYVIETYLGDEFYDESDYTSHFEYCWMKSVVDFEITEIDFSKCVKAIGYFGRVMNKLFYSKENKLDPENIIFINGVIGTMFSFYPTEVEDQNTILKQIYNLFNYDTNRKIIIC